MSDSDSVVQEIFDKEHKLIDCRFILAERQFEADYIVEGITMACVCHFSAITAISWTTSPNFYYISLANGITLRGNNTGMSGNIPTAIESGVSSWQSYMRKT